MGDKILIYCRVGNPEQVNSQEESSTDESESETK